MLGYSFRSLLPWISLTSHPWSFPALRAICDKVQRKIFCFWESTGRGGQNHMGCLLLFLIGVLVLALECALVNLCFPPSMTLAVPQRSLTPAGAQLVRKNKNSELPGLCCDLTRCSGLVILCSFLEYTWCLLADVPLQSTPRPRSMEVALLLSAQLYCAATVICPQALSSYQSQRCPSSKSVLHYLWPDKRTEQIVLLFTLEKPLGFHSVPCRWNLASQA